MAFPVRNLDLGDYVFPTDESKTNGERKKEPIPTEEEVRGMSVSCRLLCCDKLCWWVKFPLYPDSLDYVTLPTDQGAEGVVDQTWARGFDGGFSGKGRAGGWGC